MARVPVATDNFNRAGPALGANWQQLTTWSGGDITINSSTRATGYSGNGPGNSSARWVGAGTFTANQYASAKLLNFDYQNAGFWSGVIARASGDEAPANDFYYAIVEHNSSGPTYLTRVGKVVNGTDTSLATSTQTWSVNDVISLEVEGTSLRVFRNDTQIAALNVTDSSLAAGAPGVICSEVIYLDDFEGGNITAGSAAPEITDAGDETLLAGETNFPISGANFGASQGTNGAVFISPTNNSADVGRVQQTVTSWADGTVQITAVQGSLPAATNLYLFVRNDAGQFNATGYVVQFLAVPAITNAGDELHENGEVVLVQGNNFGAAQGANGKVYLSPTNNVNDGSRVEQTVNSWSNTGVEITVVKGGLSFLTQLYLFVLTNGGASNANGYAMQIEPKLYLRDKLVTLTEAPRANESGLTLLVWRQLPTAANPNPSQAIGSLSADANGDIDWRIARGSLGVGAPVWASVLKDGSPAIATMRKMIPVAE